MVDKKLDYLTKGLSLESRQTILEKIRNISTMSLERVLEKEDNYPTMRRMGYQDEDIKAYLENLLKYFVDLNKYMNECGRKGFFSNTTDSYQCSMEYFDLLKPRTEAELIEIFGSSYEEYIPQNIL